MPVPLLIALALVLGFTAGLRSLLPVAVVAWGQRMGVLNYTHWLTAWMATTPALVFFTLAAIGELVADKLPKLPSRIAPGPLAGRSITGLLCGAALSLSAGLPIAFGAISGLLGAVIGSYTGFSVRRALTLRNRKRDFPVALVEDGVALLLAIFVVSRF
jgi:uncharacterized membrane protein